MSTLPVAPAAVGLLAGGHYNSDPVDPATNPGGLGFDGHVDNFPAALAAVGSAAEYVGQAAQAVADMGTDIADQAQQVAGMLAGSDAVQAMCATSMTVTVGLTQAFQVQAGKAYLAGMPVRFAGVPPSALVMDGRIATYDRATGAGTFTCLRGDGIGQSGAAWNVMLIGQPVVAAGAYQAYLAELGSLSQWQSGYIATPGVADTAAAKKRVVTAYESGVSAQAFTYAEPYDFANRARYDWAKSGGAVGLTVSGPLGTPTAVSGGAVGHSTRWCIDLSPTQAVWVWNALGESGRIYAILVDYSNPAAPSFGPQYDTTWSAPNDFRAVRLTSGAVGCIFQNGTMLYAMTLTVSGNTFTRAISSAWNLDNYPNSGRDYMGADALAVTSVADGGNQYSGICRFSTYESSRNNNQFLRITWPVSGTPNISSPQSLLPNSSYESDAQNSGFMFCLVNGGQVIGVQSIRSVSAGRVGISAVLASAAGVTTHVVEPVVTGQQTSEFQILGLGACVGASAAWLSYRIHTGGAWRTQMRILTVNGSNGLDVSAPIFDAAVGTGAPWWASFLTGRYDGGTGYTYAFRPTRNADDTNNDTAVSVTTAGVVGTVAYTRAGPWSPVRMAMVGNPGGSLRVTPWGGFTALLGSGVWAGGDVGQYIHTSAGSARVASVSLATATLSDFSPGFGPGPVVAGAWFLSGLSWSGAMVRGWSGGRQALVTSGFGQLFARTWKALKGVTATTAGNVYLAWSFDGRRSWRVLASGASRVIASDRAADHGGPDGTWYARDGANAWTAKTSMLAALQDAMGWGVNATLPTVYNSEAVMIQTGWVAGWAAVVDFALVLADGSAAVDNLVINYDAFELLRPVDGAAVQFRLDDPAGVQVTRVASGTSAGLRVLVQY